MVAALLAREDLERLPRRADGAEALLRGGERDLGVALAVNQQEGAPDSLHHPVEPEALEPLQRRVPRGHAENPEQVLPGHGQRGRLAARDPRSGTPLKYWISFVTSKPSKKTRAGDRRAPPSA